MLIKEHSGHFVLHKLQAVFYFRTEQCRVGVITDRYAATVRYKVSSQAIKNTFCNLKNEFAGKLKL